LHVAMLAQEKTKQTENLKTAVDSAWSCLYAAGAVTVTSVVLSAIWSRGVLWIVVCGGAAVFVLLIARVAYFCMVVATVGTTLGLQLDMVSRVVQLMRH
jgi:hypothetical protein